MKIDRHMHYESAEIEAFEWSEYMKWLSKCSSYVVVTLQINSAVRCSLGIACWRCSNYVFILDLRPGFNGLSKDNCKTRQETFEFEIWCTLYQRIYVTLLDKAVSFG